MYLNPQLNGFAEPVEYEKIDNVEIDGENYDVIRYWIEREYVAKNFDQQVMQRDYMYIPRDGFYGSKPPDISNPTCLYTNISGYSDKIEVVDYEEPMFIRLGGQYQDLKSNEKTQWLAKSYFQEYGVIPLSLYDNQVILGQFKVGKRYTLKIRVLNWLNKDGMLRMQT